MHSVIAGCGWRQFATGDLAGSQNGRVMSHDRTYHPEIYWTEIVA
jgi:hypothetical protein